MNKILDEAYFDLIVEKGRIPPGARAEMVDVNVRHMIMFVPSDTIDKCSLTKYDYEMFPKCYSPLSMSSLEASNVIRVRNIPVLNLLGTGVLIGIIDTGIEYQHSAFKNADGSTRIVSIWDQTINDPSAPPEGFTYGTEYTREQINNALRSAVSLGVVPSVDEVGHGTMIAGVAAGTTSLSNNFSGVVPQSELAVVKLKPAKKNLKNFFAIPEDVLCYAETDIMLGLTYLVNVAKSLGRPIAICIALGTSQGGHDGSDVLSKYCNVLSDFNGIATVIAMGNEGNSGRHYYATLGPRVNENTFELKVGRGERGFSMEIWSHMPSSLSVDITSPTGEYTHPIDPDATNCRVIRSVFESTEIWVNNLPIQGEAGDQLIIFKFQNPQEGIWKFKIYNVNNLANSFHVWLPQENLISKDTLFLSPNPDTTFTNPAAAIRTISVAAYNDADGSIYINSGRGYTTLGFPEPDLVAPGVNIVHPALNNTYAVSSGTGVATAHTAGLVAMLFEWSVVRNNDRTFDGVDARNFLVRGAERDPNIIYPNNIFGYGKVDIYNAFEKLRLQGP